MLALIRRDPALRGWPLWLLVIGLNSSVALGLLFVRAREAGGAAGPSMFLVAAWFAVAVYLLVAPVRTRCAGFHLALPLSSQRLWLSHMAAVLLAGTSAGVLAVVAMAAQVRLLGGAVSPGVGLPSLAAFVGAGVALAAVLLQLPQPSLAHVPFTARYMMWAVVVLVGVGGLLVLLQDQGDAWITLPLALALVVGLWTLRRLPPGFTLVPAAAERPEAGAVAPDELAPRSGDRTDRTAQMARPSRWVVAKAVLLGVSGGAKEWMGVPFSALFAVVTGGGLSLVAEDLGDLRFVYIPFTTYMLFVLVGPRLSRLHHLDPLPISRAVLFAVLIVPYFALFCIGYGLGALADSVVARRGDLVQYLETRSGFRVSVPLRNLEISWSGEVPEIRIPSGESQTPAGQSLWSGSRAALYSPYAAPSGSSREFVATQLGRAAEAVYGATIPIHEIADRLRETDGAVVPADAPFTLSAYTAARPALGIGPLFPVMTTLVCGPWLLLVAALLRTYRAGVSDAARLRVLWLLSGLLLAFGIGLMAAIIGQLLPSWLFRALIEIPVRHVGESLPATVGVWIGSVVLVGLAFLLARSQFRRMEIPQRPTKFTLVEWMRGDD